MSICHLRSTAAIFSLFILSFSLRVTQCCVLHTHIKYILYSTNTLLYWAEFADWECGAAGMDLREEMRVYIRHRQFQPTPADLLLDTDAFTRGACGVSAPIRSASMKMCINVSQHQERSQKARATRERRPR